MGRVLERRGPRGLAGAAAASLALRAGALALLLVCQLLLTRALGASAFGLFALALAWMKMLSIVTSLGMERMIVRDIAGFTVRADWHGWRGLVEWMVWTLGGASVAVAAAAAAALLWIVPDPDWLPVFWTALAILPLMAVMRLSHYVLSGMQRPLLAQLPELLVQPLLFLALIGLALGTSGLTAGSAMGLQLAAAGSGALSAILLFASAVSNTALRARPRRDGRAWSRSLLPMFVLTGAFSVSASVPVVLLGWLEGPEAAGLMAVARSLADLVAMPGVAVGAILAPLLAKLAAEGDVQGLQRNITLFARAIGAIALPVALGLALFASPLLRIFGAPFAEAAAALIVLAFAQLVGTLAGANGLLLVMTGHERAAAKVSLFCLLINILLCATLIPAFGIAGAAAGAAASLVLLNLLLAGQVHRLLGLKPSAFASLGAVEVDASARAGELHESPLAFAGQEGQ